MRYTCVALALITAACSSPAPEQAPAPAATPSSATAVPPEIAQVASAAVPGLTITGGEADDANTEYEVTGTLPNGDEVELDVVQANGRWSVLEIQRDVPWASVPEPVRAAAAAAPNAFEPVRVIESRQAADGAIVYELFRAGEDGRPAGGGPAIEVRWHQGNAAIITPAP